MHSRLPGYCLLVSIELKMKVIDQLINGGLCLPVQLSLSTTTHQYRRCISEEAAPIFFCPFLLPFSLQCAASLEFEAANLLCHWSELSALFHLRLSFQTFLSLS